MKLKKGSMVLHKALSSNGLGQVPVSTSVKSLSADKISTPRQAGRDLSLRFIKATNQQPLTPPSAPWRRSSTERGQRARTRVSDVQTVNGWPRVPWVKRAQERAQLVSSTALQGYLCTVHGEVQRFIYVRQTVKKKYRVMVENAPYEINKRRQQD